MHIHSTRIAWLREFFLHSAVTGADDATVPAHSDGYLTLVHAASAPGYDPPNPTKRELAALAASVTGGLDMLSSTPGAKPAM